MLDHHWDFLIIRTNKAMGEKIITIPTNVLSPIYEKIFQLEKWENKMMVPMDSLHL